ncbi:hypothetical protein Pcinc_043353 [Petrolisthes cinctipes]|uniref:Uncharacterized protein n=1 Tax=Petrolisthes cinctipes TaxID=88211 RepID=A0AAE1BHT3_PETCI|nr:hypothetical protein Pcinc_043353 [Petrolisthes cinctipes]
MAVVRPGILETDHHNNKFIDTGTLAGEPPARSLSLRPPNFPTCKKCQSGRRAFSHPQASPPSATHTHTCPNQAAVTGGAQNR